ncbi:MAG: hypothetical protein EA390_03185 [Balneolaceae bacterium]|nr:MAG: hypothetical protein EA390_03185 [Balneolaceae bacterium]
MSTEERQKLQHLFGFDLWCTRKLTDLLLESSSFKEKSACSAFLSHIINAQEIWFNRVINLDFTDVDPWNEYPVEEMKRSAKNTTQKWIDLIGDHEINLNTMIHYQNTKGVDFKNPLWQICHHLVIHGQHHRAQISLMLRIANIEPPPTDYIHYTRLRRSTKGE